MFTRWLPFITAFILQHLIMTVGYFSLIAMRGMEMQESINLSRCSPEGLQNFNENVELCLNAIAIGFMNDPYFIARSLLFLIIAATITSYIVCLWGMKRENNLMILVSIFSSVALYKTMTGPGVVIIAVLIGHSLGWLLASRKFSKINTNQRT
jgi:hypothetical protein